MAGKSWQRLRLALVGRLVRRGQLVRQALGLRVQQVLLVQWAPLVLAYLASQVRQEQLGQPGPQALASRAPPGRELLVQPGLLVALALQAPLVLQAQVLRVPQA